MPKLRRLEAPASFEMWLADLAVEPDPDELQTLSPDERERAARFVFERDRRRFRAAHVALRSILAAKTGVPARSLGFVAGPFGKPSLAHEPACAFNLSHSGEVALVATSPRGEIGADVEVLRVVEDALDLARRNFTEAECAQLASVAPQDRDRTFLRCWTRKEACLKAIGSGLSIAPETFEAGADAQPRVAQIATPCGIAQVEVHALEAPEGIVAALAWIRQPS